MRAIEGIVLTLVCIGVAAIAVAIGSAEMRSAERYTARRDKADAACMVKFGLPCEIYIQTQCKKKPAFPVADSRLINV